MKSLKKIVVSLLVVSILSVSSMLVSARGGQISPSLKNVDVTVGKIANLNKEINQNQNFKILNDKIIGNKISEKIKDNKELSNFLNPKNSNILNHYKESVKLADLDDSSKVYLSSFENKLYSLVTLYSPDSDLLYDAYLIEKSDENVLITSRNLGKVIDEDKRKLEDFKGMNHTEKEKFKDSILKKYNEIEVSNSDSFLFNINIATAANCAGLTGTQCSWVAVGYCAAASLLGFWAGLICSVTYTYACSKC